MTTNSDGVAAVTLVRPDGEDKDPIPVYIVGSKRQLSPSLMFKIPGAIMAVWGLFLGLVGLTMGTAYMRGPIEAFCLDAHLGVCDTFKSDFEAKFPELTKRYARRDAGDFSKMINGFVDGFGSAVELQANLQQLQVALDQAQDRFDDPAWKGEVATKVDTIVTTLNTLGEGNTDPEVVSALDSFKGALTQVKEAVAAGNRDGFNSGMAALNTASQQFAAQQGKLMTGSLQQGN